MHRRTQQATATRRWSLLVLGAVLLLSGLAAFEINASCNYYYPSKPGYDGYNAICWSWGYGCTECVDGDYNSCATNGNSCVPRQNVVD